MTTTTTLITVAPTGRTIAKAYTRGTDALATNGNATSLTYGSANVNLLTIIWTDLADGDYDFILTNAGGSISSDVLRVSGVTAILLGDREYAELNTAQYDAIIAAAEGSALDAATKGQINRIEATASGTLTGAGTSTEVFVGPSATVTITVDASGNRSAVVVT